MAEDRGKSNDLVLVPGEYAYVQDNTKGGVEVFVGPHKAPLSESDRVVTYDAKSKRFVPAGSEQKSLFATAPEGWYIVLKNPAVGNKRPPIGTRSATPDLNVGRKVIVPGPDTFPLWPGQMAIVRQGHALRSNQYILARVYNETAAKENWTKAVVKPQLPASGESSAPVTTPTESQPPPPSPPLTMGQLLVIKGTDVAFYIPPTGIEVVWDGITVDAKGQPQLVRDAVTLESLEYCILLDQDGNKRIEQGPAVVFPEPTEIFVEKEAKDEQGNVLSTVRKFRAIELNEHSGIYVKVIAPYEDQEREYKQGEELFITGKEQQIYFPREEHAIIRYGHQDVHYAITIPDGEGRYILDRDTGAIAIVKGPFMLLPDPRRAVVVRRVLDPKLVAFLYPGNQEAINVNVALATSVLTSTTSSGSNRSDFSNQADFAGSGIVATNAAFASAGGMVGTHALISAPVADTEQGRGIVRKAGRAFAGDAIVRNQGYTEPRTITLNTKYQGPPTIDVWTGYACMLVRKNGDRRVIVGPKTALLEYDETPQIMALSTGKPKSTDKLEKTAYLCVSANKVSDVMYVETSDLVGLRLKLSYRVSFEGEPTKWFAVDNYVKFMCDHMRSKLRNAIMSHAVEDFYSTAVDTIRDIVLGAPGTIDPGNMDEMHPGTFFEENGMRIYDVEVLGIEFVETDVQKLLIESQRGAIRERLELEAAKRKLLYTQSMEEVKRSTIDAQSLSVQHMAEQKKAELQWNLEIALKAFENDTQTGIAAWKIKQSDEVKTGEVQILADERQRRTKEIQIALEEKVIQLRLNELKAEVEALVAKAGAINPGLIEALQAFGQREMVERVSQSMAPMALLGGTSVMDVVSKLFAGTNLAKVLAPTNGTNGTTSRTTPSAPAA